ncbi:MAG: M3 family metallopeptidase [Myxococcota bacterium]
MSSQTATPPTWDLDVLVSGGPGGPAFSTRRDTLRQRLEEAAARVAALGAVADDPAGWAQLIVTLTQLDDDLGDLSSFAGCASAVDARSEAARAAEGDADELERQRKLVVVALDATLDAAPDAAFDALLARPELADHAAALRHQRAGKRLRLPPALQALKVAMDREALTAWGRLYDQISGTLTAELALPGQEPRRVGIAEVAALRADPDPEVRARASAAGAAAWGSVRDLCAHTLTQIVGARQQHNDRLGVDELAYTMHGNRVDAALLDAMWAAADAARPALVRYLRHKATLLGKERLDWYDVEAPVGSSDRRWAWGDATRDILGAFGGFHPELATFAGEALDGRWVDALPREGRLPGGFCAGFREAGQSRIFMTFTGTLDNATTLAHELGHAYHNRVLDAEPSARCALTSALAETASTFAEAIFRDRLLATAPTTRSAPSCSTSSCRPPPPS